MQLQATLESITSISIRCPGHADGLPASLFPLGVALIDLLSKEVVAETFATKSCECLINSDIYYYKLLLLVTAVL